MKLKLKSMLPFAAALVTAGSIAFSPAALSQTNDDDLKIWMMLRDASKKSMMISKQQFMKVMESRWNMMDKEKKGQMSAESVRKLVDIDFMHAP